LLRTLLPPITTFPSALTPRGGAKVSTRQKAEAGHAVLGCPAEGLFEVEHIMALTDHRAMKTPRRAATPTMSRAQSIQGLGFLPGGNRSNALGVNADGLLAGVVRRSQ
jgi:hypothetical protein